MFEIILSILILGGTAVSMEIAGRQYRGPSYRQAQRRLADKLAEAEVRARFFKTLEASPERTEHYYDSLLAAQQTDEFLAHKRKR